MTDAKHAPGELSGKIRLEETADGWLMVHHLGSDGWVAEFSGSGEQSRRLVACWNACRGLSTKALEGGRLIDLTEFELWQIFERCRREEE